MAGAGAVARFALRAIVKLRRFARLRGWTWLEDATTKASQGLKASIRGGPKIRPTQAAAEAPNTNRASLSLEFEAGWNRRDFSRKVRALQDLAERGKLRKAPNPVARDPNITGQYKNRLIRRAYDQFAESDPQKFARLRDRIRQMHPDHIQDLQLSGLDDASNLWLLDADVNVGLGRQIWQQIRNLPDGTIIDRIDVIGF